MAGVREHRDPLALAGLAPALEAGRVERLAEEATTVERVADGAGAVVARVLPAAVATAVLVRLAGDRVGGGDHVLDLLRRAVGRDRGPAVGGERRLRRRVAAGGVVALPAAALAHRVRVAAVLGDGPRELLVTRRRLAVDRPPELGLELLLGLARRGAVVAR